MSKKHPRKSLKQKKGPKAKYQSQGYGNLGVPQADVRHFMSLYESRQLSEAQNIAQGLVARYPESAFAWKALGTSLLEDRKPMEALPCLERACELDGNDGLALTSLAAAYYRLGEFQKAVTYQERAVDLKPDYAMAQYNLAEMLQSAGNMMKALKHAEKAKELGFDAFKCWVLIGALKYQTKYFSEALEIYHCLEESFPPSDAVLNNLGNLYKDIGDYQKAESYYSRALEVNPDYVMAYSNIFYAKHYNPKATQEEIITFAKRWDDRFALPPMPPVARELARGKVLRVGLISSGFRTHPVGQMITTALENSQTDIQFYGYTTNDQVDQVTERLRAACSEWRPIRHLSQTKLAQLIRDDQIDILIDLSGHGDGSCLQAISMRPAPINVKWVGGLVNTMAVESIDYLLSDSIETPEGVDDQYTEKLIRLPDDYICYTPCPYAPPTTSPPALKNGYITLGCLNNPAKISAELLAEWAKLMHELPQSRILLRGAQYESESFCQKIHGIFTGFGIDATRVILEGPTKHEEFLKTYQRIDIALDTWPYSGGLTTCEALLMGVPVVTLPGPTFAGRHSATHLTNAGLQELVVNNWDEYRQRVLELAKDMPNLAVIRAGLRTILHYSPVCDAPRFANHFNKALRAIWVRYCEGKSPEALTFNKEGELWFEDDKQPLELPEACSEEEAESKAFEWQLDEPITIIDNAAVLPRHPDYPKWMASGHLAVISFDPASLLNKRVEELKGYGELHHYPHALLGDGQPATLYATLDAEKGSTLKPLPEEQQPEYMRDKLKVLAELPINTVALDQIEGLPSVDMLVLDDLHDAMKVLENGLETLKKTLLIQVKVLFQPTHERQCNVDEIGSWMSLHGFRFSGYVDLSNCRDFSACDASPPYQAAERESCGALFMPSQERMTKLSREQRVKLTFILRTVYAMDDFPHDLLNKKYIDSCHSGGGVNIHDESLAAGENQEIGKPEFFERNEVNQKIDALAPVGTGCDENYKSVDQRGMEKKCYQWHINDKIFVADIGANPIDGTPPYSQLLRKGALQLFGFEPQREALAKLNQLKGEAETYFPHAVGDGGEATLYLCKAPGMTSTLKPNKKVLDLFQGYPIWGKVEKTVSVPTVRLDDIDEVVKIDWLKIDIQGGELTVFQNAEEKLKDALVIQTEVNFISLYENQPLFSDIDEWMRERGFMLHALLEQRKRLYAPMVLRKQIHQGINQLTTADAIYVRDVNFLDELTEEQKKKMALILHSAYGSYDLALRILSSCESVDENEYIKKIKNDFSVILNNDVSLNNKLSSINQLVFVAGCGHTGTTLMASILGAHSNIFSIPRETNWFLSDDGKFHEEYRKEVLKAVSEDKTILCEKTPRHLHKMSSIREKFPSAKFIIMTRDVKDVVFSIKNRTGDFRSALNRWVGDNKVVLEELKNKNVLLVRYEDLVVNPKEMVKNICDFLGVSFESGMLEFYKNNTAWFGLADPSETDGKGEKSHLERRAWQMTQPIHDRRGIWKGGLSNEEISVINSETCTIMSKLGYN
ncbi:FkbM family methyltransferase [Billgrantia sp. Q4P2]|uniref:FkbM family methyltransferase n=1 Tax=Billgrantia sp. Q4P2 TaxID=3463857 RepID=UPI0040563E30